ncbi:MAG: anion transporter [Chloroflexi bacterium]|nr:anion transporter [Chloroflexota bacterium]
MIAASIILALSYIGIAATRLPRVNIDRPAAALLGALLMVLLGVLTFPQAVAAVDFNTLALLLGMMLLVAVLGRGGFFTLLATRAVSLAPTPARLMVSVVVATAVLSAFLVNDVVVLLFTPVVIGACRLQRVNPVPYLIGEAMASNIGSTATIVGNPQNMLIGVTSGISFARFFAYLAPVAAVATLLLLGGLWAFYRKEMAASKTGATTSAAPAPMAGASDGPGTAVDRRVLRRTVPVLALVTVGFFASSLIGISVPLIALTAGAAAVLVSGIKPSEVIRDVDWVLLLFFGGLFVIIGGARQAGVLDALLSRVDLSPNVGGILSMHLFSAAVSQLVSNVPLTVLVLPLLQKVPGDTLWVSLAAGATLGGNATLIGAVANIIVAEQAARQGVQVRFGEFLKVGLPVTVVTLLASAGILLLEFHLGLLR